MLKSKFPNDNCPLLKPPDNKLSLGSSLDGIYSSSSPNDGNDCFWVLSLWLSMGLNSDFPVKMLKLLLLLKNLTGFSDYT